MLGFPFRPNTSIATLPISLRGFEFPSITRINHAIAISGISRMDVSHPLTILHTPRKHPLCT